MCVMFIVKIFFARINREVDSKKSAITKSQPKPKHRLGQLKNRYSKRSDTSVRFENRTVEPTDCIGR
jgi:hypothetical protein